MTTTVPKGVIEDLIPVYLAGEASPDTKKLVEQYVSAHPEMAALMQGTQLPDLNGGAAPDLGLRALQQTRILLKQRTSFLVLAAVLSVSIFTFSFHGSNIRFLLFRDAPVVAWTLLAASVLFYVRFYLVCRQLVVTGLGAPHHMLEWGVGAAVASVPFTFLASLQTGWELTRDLAVPAFFGGLALARLLNQRGSRPITPDAGQPRS